MWKIIPIPVLIIFCLAAIPYGLAADGLSGTYAAVGTNPGNKGKYYGTVSIRKTGDTYRLTWTLAESGQVYNGTGIRTGNVLSVAYSDKDRQWFGVISYKITSRGQVLHGNWCGHREMAMGSEILTKKL